MSCYRSVLAACALASAGCIATRSEDPHGSAHFIASAVPNPADYAPRTSAPGAAGAIAAPPTLPASGTGPALQPPPPPPGAGVAGMPATLPMTGGAPARAGAPAAVSGGSGPARGAAGMMAAGSSAGPATAAGSAAPPTTGDHAGMLTLDFKTVNQGGTYAPQNVGAVWIETASGMFVKTVERWGNIRSNHLTRWNMASGGWGSIFGGGNTADQMDAVSRATLRSHGAHHDTWDMKDPSGNVVADGSYKVVIEVTEDNFRPGASGEVPFEKGAMPQAVTAPDKAPFAGLMLTYQP